MRPGPAIAVLSAPMLCAAFVMASAPAPAQSHGGMNEAGIVILERAPVYPNPRSTRPTTILALGAPVAASVKVRGPDLNFFQEKFGRVRVVYFRGDRLHDFGWIEAAALARFYYGACPPVGGPMMMRGVRWEWTDCFKSAHDAKLQELGMLVQPARP